MYKKQINMQSN